VGELGKFSADLLSKTRWLVLNKSDLMPPEEAVAKAVGIAQALDYRGPAFLISGATHAGTSELCEAVMRFLETGEAPAAGNLPLPVLPVRRAPAARKASPRKASAKSAAKAKAAKKVGKPARKAAPKTKPKSKRPSKRAAASHATPKRSARKKKTTARKK
jgi:GTP-binding protein